MITKTFDGKTLIIVLENGVDANGNPLYSKKSIKYFKEDATIDTLHDVGTKLSALYVKPLSTICVDEDYVLSI